jgi:hypothetical protein
VAYAPFASFDLAIVDVCIGPDTASRCNYFEIEILNLGDKVTVGFVNSDDMELKDETDGWRQGYYAYCSNDGECYGFNSTGRFDAYAAGDVIGCGFDIQKRAIFYTLNGTFLGVAFHEVPETKLTPIISFHGADCRVRLNAGDVNFRYEGSEISRCNLAPQTINPLKVSAFTLFAIFIRF